MTKINEIIKDAKTVGISGHVRPDGDCIGSCMALYNYLAKNRPDLHVKVYLEFVDDKFKMIPNTEKIVTDGYDGTVYDLFIALDTAAKERLGFNLPYFENAKRTVCIDHHASNQGYAKDNIIEPKASSASEVLYDLLEEELFDCSVATPMYMGIAHDSGVFRFQSTTPKTMRIAAKMIEYGVDFNTILEETFYRKTYQQMMITAEIQRQAVLCMDGNCIYSYCTAQMMKQYRVAVNDLDAVVASIRNVAGIETAVFAYELEDGKFKFSLRSKKKMDVSKIAVRFGGGGHVRAAGFELEGPIDAAMKIVLDAIAAEI